MSKPYVVGRWCYYNDEPCPYVDADEEFEDWRKGYMDALREDYVP